MQNRRNLFIILTLFSLIFSMSIVVAGDNVTSDTTNQDTVLSVTDDINDVQEISVEKSQELELSSDVDQSDTINNSEKINENPSVLGATNDEPVLGMDRHLSGGTMDDIKKEILDISQNGGGILYLNGGNYTGSTRILAGSYDESNGDNWWDDNGTNSRPDKVYISNVKIYGGYQIGDGIIANFGDSWDYALTFGVRSSKSPFIPNSLLPDAENKKRGYYSDYGCFLTNIVFENLNATKLVNFQSGSLTNCVINNCTSKYQFMGMEGCYWDNVSLPVINCNFTNCHQTYKGANDVNDGSGQLGAVFGINMTNCNFINTSSAQHGGALCIADESNWGSSRVASVLTNCSFINITSRWFAIYIHGNFSSSYDEISTPEIIQNCKFINCIGTGEYSGAIGISHDDLIVRDSEFIGCIGGQGAAIMVGGIDGAHDGFSGRNSKGNNVTIQGCTFTDNIAKIEGQSYSFCVAVYKPMSDGKWSGEPRFDYNDATGEYTENPEGDYYQKHPDKWFYPSGDAGAVYIFGNDTKIIGCKFNGNEAESGNGSAIYIVGERTIVNNCEFYNHDAANGTIYIKGNDAKIIDSNFKNNTAEESGSAIYIIGNRTEIDHSTFEENEALNGTVFIKGDNTKIIHDSMFKKNDAVNGAGVFIDGKDTIISGSTFEQNRATNNGGGVYADGDDLSIFESTFKGNNATNGAGAYVEGHGTEVSRSKFESNNVTNQGGALFVDGSDAYFSNNNFTNNEAYPTEGSLVSGLGGAIFVIGDSTDTYNNEFEHNKARNGSAIYSTGTDFTLNKDIFKENQAWSYLLITVAEPNVSLYNTSDVAIKVVHIGGDNMINAIHNNASNDQIILKNVTYINNYHTPLVVGVNEPESPVDGVENSQKGTLLYQDDREYHQQIHINVTDDEGNAIYKSESLITNLYGDVYVTLDKSKLKEGSYKVSAMHPEDWNYKEIFNSTSFRVLGHVDLSIVKTSDKLEYFDDDIVKWTITVYNAGNSTNATHVVVNDLLPSQFVFVNASSSDYDNITGVWNIGFMENGTSKKLVIYALAKSYIDRMNNVVNIDCNEKNPNFTIDRTLDPNKSEFEEGDLAKWIITITNNGNFDMHELALTNVFPFEFELENYTAQGVSYDENDNRKWTVGTLGRGLTATLVINSRAITNVTTITNFIDIDYKEKHLNLTVDKESDKNEYVVGDEALWTITVHNGEGCAATDVVLKDILQQEFEFVDIVSVDGTYSEDTNVWTIGNMAENSEAKLVIKSKAKRFVGSTTNTAVVTSDEADWNNSNNVANQTVTVFPLPQPVKTVNNTFPYYHDYVEYNLTLVNTGNISYTKNLTVIDTLPDGLVFDGIINVIGAEVLNQAGAAHEEIDGKDVYYVVDGQKITWKITNIAANSNATIIIRVKVNDLGNLINNRTVIDNITNNNKSINSMGNLTNSLTVIGPNGTNYTANKTIYPLPIVDLSVNKTSDKAIYYVDDIVVWTITVYNAGNGTNATNVTLKDLLPSQFEYINCTPGAVYNATTGVWTIGFMGNGTNVTINITSRVRDRVPNVMNVTNDANVTCNETDWKLTNNKDNETVKLIPLPEPVKTVNNLTPYYHDEILYNLTIVNKGNVTYENVVTVVDSLPDGLDFIGMVGIVGADVVNQTVGGQSVRYVVSADGRRITWILTNISKENATITVKVKVNALGNLITNKTFIDNVTNKITINSIGNLTNNLTVRGPNGTIRTVNKTIYPVPIVDVSANITSDGDEYFIDDIAVWTITVYNAGNGTNATNVTLKDFFPSEYFDLINSTTHNGTFNETTGVWTIGFMANGTNATLTVTSRAIKVGTVGHDVSVSCNETDWNLTNNDARKTVNVVFIPNPVKTVNNDTPFYHDMVEYNLTLVNDANNDYVSVLTVVDSLPDGLVFDGIVNVIGADVVNQAGAVHVVIDGNDVYYVVDGQKIILKIKNIKANSNATIIVRAKVNSLDNLTNNLTAIGPNGTNKTVNETVYPVPIVDLSVDKSSDHDEYFINDTAIWTIVVSNAGNGTNATLIILKDTLPSQFEFKGFTVDNAVYNAEKNVWTIASGINAGVNITYSAGVWNIGSMANGTSITLKINSTAKVVVTNVTNKANVTCNETDWNKTNNENNATVAVIPHPVKTVNNITPYYHDVIEYTLAIVNNGDSNYTGVVTVVDSLPIGLDFNGTYKVIGAVEVGTGVQNGRIYTWKLTNITKDAKILVWVKVNDLGNLTNNVTLISPKGISKMDNETVYPVPIVDLSVVKISDKAVYFVDDIVVWTITVHNAANGTNATNVTLKDILPSQFEYINCTSGAEYNATTGVWNIGFMGNGTSRTINITSRVKDVVPDVMNVTNNATVTCNETDWNLTNNKENETVKLVSLPNPVKTVNNVTPYYHDEILYNLTIVNKGNVTYENVVTVVDSLPDGLDFIGMVGIVGADVVNQTVGGQSVRYVVSADGRRITWILTNISKENATITVKVKVNALGNLITNKTFIDNVTNKTTINSIGNLTNNLTVIGPNGTNRTVNETIYPVPIVDLSVVKISDRAVYFVDDIVVWTITVHNAGNGTNATNVNLKDILPSQFEYINCTSGDYNATTGVWTIGFMGNGTSRTINITSRVRDVVPDVMNVTNNATVTCNETDWNITNNKDNETVKLVPLPDPLKAVNNITPYYHDVIEYTITVVNKGGVTYSNVLNVTDSLPDGLLFNGTYRVSNANVTKFVNDGQKLTWSLTNISKDNATITLWVKVVGLGDLIENATFAHNITNNDKVDYVGNLTNNVTVTGPNGTTRNVSKTIYPVPIVDVSVVKISDRAVYFVDDIAVWTITVYNAGNGTNATFVTLKDILPSQFEYINCTSGCDYNATTGVWNIGFMGNGTSRTINITSRVKDVVPDVMNVTNNVTVTCNETDWNLTNNDENETVKLVPLPDPLKAVNNITPYYHDVIEYTITVVNKGGVTYSNVLNVTDSLPDGLLFNGTYRVSNANVTKFVNDGQKLTWSLTNISKDNATITLWVKVIGLGDLIKNATFAHNITNNPKVDYVGSLTNNVTVKGPKGTIRNVSKTIYPVPIVDLSVIKISYKDINISYTDVFFVDDIVVWTITVYNADNGTNATNVILKDILPSQFEFISCPPECVYDPVTGVWNIGFMGNGTSRTIKITSRVKDVVPDVMNVTNNATVTCNEIDWNLTNNYDNKTVKLVPLPEPIKTVNNITPYYHDMIEYTITVVNKGGVTYINVLNVTDSLPDGLLFNGTYKVSNANMINFINDGQKLTWTLKDVSKDNATITLWVKVVGLGDLIKNATFAHNITNNPKVDYVGSLTNNVTVKGPKGTIRNVSKTIYPVPIVDLSVIKISYKDINISYTDVFFVDDIVVWTITVYNADNGTNATNVILKDILPSQFEFISCPPECVYDPVTGVWNIGFMGNGTSRTIKITSRVKDVVPDVMNVTNNATVTCNEIDWNLTNNYDNKTVKLVPLPEPIKTVNNITPYYHDMIEYTITVVNKGGVTYINVLNVTDSLPDGLLFNGTYKVSNANMINFINDGQKLSWTLGNISKDNATITLWVKVVGLGDLIKNATFAHNITNNDKVDYVGSLTNNVTVTGPNGTTRNVSKTIYPVPIVDVSVVKISDKVEYLVGDIAVWTITVYNAGNGTNATNVTLKDILPSQFEFISCTSGDYNATTGVWTIGFMGNGTNRTINITSRAKTVVSNVINVANVTCNETDWNRTNNVDNVTVDILPYPEKTVNNNTPYYHDVIEYTLSIVNNGDSNYTNIITVIDSLPVGLDFNGTYKVIGAVEVETAVQNGRTFTWKLTNITTDAKIIVWVKVNDLGNLTNNLTVVGPNGTEKMVNYTVYPVPIVDLSVIKISDRAVYFIDDIAVWTITVHNAYNGTNATNVTLKDILPSQFEFISCTPGCNYNATTGVWKIEFMGNGTTVSINITSRVKDVVPNVINVTNNATVTCNETDWNLTNNDENETVKLVPLPEPIKAVNNITPYYHDMIEYTITVVNKGGVTYINVLNVTDILPEGLLFNGTYKVSNANVTKFINDGQKLTWSLTNISKDNATITLWVKVVGLGDLIKNATFAHNITNNTVIDYVGSLTNNVTVTGPNGTTRNASKTVYPVPIVDVSVVKVSDKVEYLVGDIAVWTITVYNAGNGTNATYVTLKDILPSQFEFINCTPGCDYNATTGVWTIGVMANGTSVTINITSRAKTVVSNVINVANVTCNETDWNRTNNVDNVTVDILPYPEKTVNNNTPYYHDVIEYTLSIVNNGDSNYTNIITVIDSLPVGLDFNGTYKVIGAVEVETAVQNGRTFTWKLTNITTDAKIIVWVKVNDLGNLTNNLTVVGPNGTEKMDNCTVYPVPIVDVSVVKISDRVEYLVGDIAVWTITVYNAGNGTNATNVTLKDILPSQFEFINCTPGCKYNATTGVWTIGFMGNGTSMTINITSRAKTVVSDVINVANVTCNETDWNRTNNVDNVTVDILPYPEKTVNNNTPYYHDVIEYTLSIVNNGDSNYTNIITVIDSLPVGLDFNGTYKVIGAVEVETAVQNGRTFTWKLTNITTDAKIIVWVKVNDLGNLTNNLTVVGPNGTENMDNCTVYPVPIVDVSVVKTSDKDEYFVDDVAVWTITVYNAGNGTNATNVTLKDILPSQFEFISCTPGADYNATTGVWTIGFMGNGTNITLVIKSLAKTPATGINNMVNVTCKEDDWNETNNKANKMVDIVVLPQPEKTVNNSTPYNHDTVEYNLTITNVGKNPYESELIVVDSLPDGLIFNGTVGIKGADLIREIQDGQKITWIITNISNKTSAVITVKVFVNDIGNLTNNLTVTGPYGTNHTVNCTIESKPIADLEATITNNFEGTNATCHKGDTVVWTITVTNHGPNVAVNTTLKDVLPEGLIYVSDDSNGTYDRVSAVWTIGNLTVGQTVTLKITTVVNTTNTTIFRNVTVSSDIHDPDLSNNHDNSSVVIPPEADLEIVKLVSDKAPHKGNKITWTLVVTNHGPDCAVNVVVTDKLPKGLVYVSDDSMNRYDHNTGKWNVGDLASGESATLKIVTLVDTTDKMIVNVADVISQIHDPNLSNNHCENSTTVPPEADLVITVKPGVKTVTVGEEVTYKVTVKNQGPDTAENTRATIKLPNSLKLLGFKPSRGTYNPKTGIWDIGDLAPGEEVTLLLYTKALQSGTIVVEASVKCDTYETDLSNNHDSAEILVKEPPIDNKHDSVPPKTMHATGNPILIALLALVALAGAGFKRKFR